jgi:CotS family spore coat protein
MEGGRGYVEQDQPLEVLLHYGADPEVLEEYDCVPLKARIVHDVVKVRTASGSRSLKKVYLPVERMEDVFRCTEYMAGHRGRLSFVPRLIRTRYGDPYVNHSSGLYYMTAWRAGREADFRKEAEFLAGGQLLAHWHQATEGCPCPDSGQMVDMTMRMEESLAQIQGHQSRLRSSESNRPFERLFLSCCDELLERGHLSIEQLHGAGLKAADAAARKRGLLCHGNLSRQNVVYDGATYTLLNYERVYAASPLNDLALYIHRYMPAYDWDAQILGRVVSDYREAWMDETFDEYVMYALLGAPLRSLQVITWYFNRAKDWDEEDFIDYLEAALELEEVREAARESIAKAPAIPSAVSGQTLQTRGQSEIGHRTDGSTKALEPALAGKAVRVGEDRATDGDEGVDVPVQMEDGSQLTPGRRKSGPGEKRQKRPSQRRRRGSDGAPHSNREVAKGPRIWGDVSITKDES